MRFVNLDQYNKILHSCNQQPSATQQTTHKISSMFNFTSKIIDHSSHKVSTLSFTNGSHLLVPGVNGEGSSQGSRFPKSICPSATQLSTQSNIYSESVFEDNLAKSRKSKESIELKRSIIKKMSEKILSLEKKSKNQKMDIFELQAYKNDLLIDFLEYQQSKRKHQQELIEKQDHFQQEQKSFFFMKHELRQTQPSQKALETVKFTKNPSKPASPVEQQITKIKVTPIQILVPMIKMINIQIPILNLAQNKIRSTETTLPTKWNQQGEQYFAAISNQVNSVYNVEIQHNGCEYNLPLDSSRSGISLNQARMLDFGTETSQKSINYRKERSSDRFFIQQQDLIKNLKEKDQVYYNQLTQRNNFEYNRQTKSKMNQSYDQGRNKSQNSSLKQSIMFNELKLNSQISQKQSSKYQQKRLSIDNQTKDFYRNKISELQQQLRQKAETIAVLLQKNEQFVKELDRMNCKDQRKEQIIESTNIKIEVLQEKVEQLQKYVREVEETAQENSNKLINEIVQLSGEVQTKNEELGLMIDSMQVVEQNAYKRQKDLMREIQSMQNTIQRMKDQIEFYKKRFQQEGIKLNFTEIEMIEEAIEDRQKMYQINIQKLKDIYESELSQLKKKFSTLQDETKQLQEKNQHVSLESQTKGKFIHNNSFIALKEENIREIMDLYDAELQSRDQEIISLKHQLAHCNLALLEAIDLLQFNQPDKTSVHIQCEPHSPNPFTNPHDEIIIQILTQKNRTLEQRLANQLFNRQQMTQKLLKLQKFILSDLSSTECSTQKIDYESHEKSNEYELIQALTNELDCMMNKLKKEKQTNKKMKKKLNEQRPCSPSSEAKQIRQVRQKLSKLTKYSQLLEKEIKQIYKVEECQAHQKIIQRLQLQLKACNVQHTSQKIQSIMGLTQ